MSVNVCRHHLPPSSFHKSICCSFLSSPDLSGQVRCTENPKAEKVKRQHLLSFGKVFLSFGKQRSPLLKNLDHMWKQHGSDKLHKMIKYFCALYTQLKLSICSELDHTASIAALGKIWFVCCFFS